MAKRNVLLSWGGKCLTLSAMDADALIQSGMLRATTTHYAGELSDATVLHFRQEYLQVVAREINKYWETEDTYTEALRRVKRLPLHGSKEFDLSGGVEVAI